MSSGARAAAEATGVQNYRRHRRRRRAKSRGVTTLMYAAQQGDVERVRRIIRAQSSSLFDRDRTGKTALHYCCTSDSICSAHAADLLVMAAPDLVEERDEDGFTPLHLAVIAGNMQLVTFLLANNADVNAVDNEMHTAVHWATVCGETAALRAIMAAGAPVSTPDLHGGYPLHYAAQMCGGISNDRDSNLGLQVLQTLLAHKDVVITVTDGDKRQPLLWAASAGSSKAVLALVRAGATVEAADKDGLTALHCAASRGHTDCLDTLLTLCGASPDFIDTNGCTALHYAVTLGHADATALLLAHGADPNRQDRKGRSPAHCGCAKGQFETVKLIGSHRANLWLKNARGDLPLHEAAASGRRELVKWLLEMRPSQVNARNNDGKCPLHMSALNDNADMCKILLDAGAQVNPVLRTSRNIFMTPLDCALQRGFRSTAKYLQLHGGVPASRLAELRNQPTSANLQIRDDVTFWEETSSESGKEQEVKSGRKSFRKRTTHKLEKPKVALSASDEEVGKSETGTDKSKKKYGDKTKSPPISSTKRSSSRKLPSSRMEYTNEIIINGKTEINIHQTREIIIEKEPTLVDKITETVSCETDIPQSASSVKHRRPRSAKFTKSGDRSAKTSAHSRIASPETVIQQEQELRQSSLKTQSTNTSEETAETVIENKPVTAFAEDGFLKETPHTKKVDQQSLMSNTSEDVEEHKEFVVEASIHEPPKSRLDHEKEVEDEENHQCDLTKGEDLEEEETKLDTNDIDLGKETGEVTTSNMDNVEDTKQETTLETEALPDIDTKSKISDTNDGEDKSVKVNEPSDLQKENEDVEPTAAEEQPVEEAEESNQITAKSGSDKEDEVLNELEGTLPEPDASLENVDDHETKEEIENNVENVEDCKNEAMPQETQEDNVVADEEVEKTPEKQPPEGQDENEVEEETKLEEPVDPNGDDITEKSETDVLPNKTGAESMEVKEEIADVKPDSDELVKKRVSKQKEAPDGKDSNTKNKKLLNAEKPKKRSKAKKQEGSDEEYSSRSEDIPVPSPTIKSHKSFRVLDETENPTKGKSKRSEKKESRSRSEENKKKEREKFRHSKIPTPLGRTVLSKSDRHLDKRALQGVLDARVPSLPNIHQSKTHLREPPRSESNMSAPLLASLYSDDESLSETEREPKGLVARNKKRVKKRPKTREARSAGSDYESSNLIDSGFEPSPRSTRIPKWRNMTDRSVNMTSVTQNIQTNIRRYHLERKIFQHLLELKRHQIRAGQHNEAVLVKRAIDAYHHSCASTVGAGRYIPDDYSFKSFERFLYESLRKLQKNDLEYMKGLPAAPANPLLCTRSTNRCMHATHAYTGVPCAAYLPKMDHHTIPKIGFNDVGCKPGTGFLPSINSKKAVTLELSHGADKQVISLPTDRLDQNKRYYVTFTVKGHDPSSSNGDDGHNKDDNAHIHSKSD